MVGRHLLDGRLERVDKIPLVELVEIMNIKMLLVLWNRHCEKFERINDSDRKIPMRIHT